MSEHVLVESRGPILHLRLNRPEKKNALSLEMYAALTDALRRADADEEVRVVVLSGEGDAFTGGNDLRDFLERPPLGEDSPVLRFLETLIRTRVPVVAAVHGLAVGVGTTMLLHCDLVYASRSARFHLPFVQLGLVPEAGSSLLLPRRIGPARAAELLLLGEPLDAARAESMGLLSAVFADHELMDQVWERARRLANLPPAALRATKELLRQEDREVLPERMKREAEAFVERLRSSEAQAIMQAFLQGRSAPP